jgi:hypothetical protein
LILWGATMRFSPWAVWPPLVLLVGCWASVVAPTELFRYRMSVTVEDHGRLITAQAVRQYSHRPARLGGFQVGADSDIGDSVIVPVRDKLLVVTHGRWFGGFDTCVGPRRSGGGEPCSASLGGDWLPPKVVKDARGGEPVELAPFEYPIIVTFDGPPDLRTIVAVDPADLGPQFGEGVHIRDITVTRTFGFLSRGQAKQLPFVKTLTGVLMCSEHLRGPWRPENQTRNSSLGACIPKGFF